MVGDPIEAGKQPPEVPGPKNLRLPFLEVSKGIALGTRKLPNWVYIIYPEGPLGVPLWN